MTTEIWKPIPGWPEYHVSSLGRVRRAASARGAKVGRVLKTWIHKKSGYPCVTLYRNNVGRSIQVHRLLALAFLPASTPDRYQVAHWDGDATNVAIGNLRWATPVENSLDRHRHGTDSIGERNPMARLTAEQVREIRSAVKGGDGRKIVAVRYGIARQTVDDIVSGRRWGHLQ
ncbi:NUMOD4 domain-containing protein [Burkholderia ubonensis]|uniref:NUMOD4 domain-containing protein n=1 Tax=Burkholderia ubonensis TaxID=101571 RepID=UPI000AB0E099|nr:NUMOD4 domain-containing protein [Burkholderia ubonensis]